MFDGYKSASPIRTDTRTEYNMNRMIHNASHLLKLFKSITSLLLTVTMLP